MHNVFVVGVFCAFFEEISGYLEDMGNKYEDVIGI